MSRRIVLDTNCLLQAISRRSRFYPIWRDFVQGRYDLCVTTEILDEYEEILSRHTSPVVGRMVAAVLKAYGWPTDLTEPEIVSRLFAMYEKLLMLYFRVGAYISANSRKCKWGSGAIDSISSRLQQELPGLRGFSATNIKSMRLFFEAWLGGVVTAAIRQLPTADKDNVAKSGMTLPLVPYRRRDGGGTVFVSSIPDFATFPNL